MVIGPTMCGKSHLVKKGLVREARRRGRAVLVFDPLMSKDWGADWVTDDMGKFLARARSSSGCLLVIDEAGEACTMRKEHDAAVWLATRSRHNGHRCIFIAQRGALIRPTFRQNCATLFLFGCYTDEAELWARELVEPGLCAAPDLPRFEYLCKTRFAPLARGKVNA